MAHPLRLRTSTKLGYKDAKWIKAIEVTNDFPQDLLVRARRKLVRRNLGERGRHIDPDPQPDFWEAAAPARHKRNPHDHTHTVDRIFGERE